MPGEYPYIDATNDPNILSKTARDVARTRKSQIVKVGEDELVEVSPVGTPTKQPGRALPDNSGLRSLIGIASSSDGATDVSENVDKYLADAVYAEAHPPKEK